MSTDGGIGSGAALRAARREKGWSQADAARELAELGRSRGAPTAAPASLKTQLSRWENGHAVPEPLYRRLLTELYGRTEFGLEPPAPVEAQPAGTADRLRALLAEAEAVDDDALALIRDQLTATRRLDARLGAAGTAGTVNAQVEQLERLLLHTVSPARRQTVAAVLADAALLAGWQALDQDRACAAWAGHTRARSAAAEAGTPELLAQSLAGQAAVLVELGRPEAAAELLADSAPPGAAAAWTAAALGGARAAAGDLDGSRRAFDAAERAVRTRPVPDVVRPGLALDYDGVHRWRSTALAGLGDLDALDRLRGAVTGETHPVRERAAMQAELAITLVAAGGAEEGADHARSARLLAARIGSHRVTNRLDRSAPTHDRITRG
ncbi:helix-turn-helix domain-containing protein [Pseudonocardia acidicola]|uniref:Helix-turn-helix transcriptional regulator n=1 Tax=Pseudonocardia acidicola TaxID=2724939 RepID=A0ABX1SBV6_9PSEU|nr:helix-turn-helix transcriptional regulator [Pseudonocardia acidicola]NMH99051.1 helix-turn-helix transcriptional regulator [Pseudonocardia acidicola]